MSEHSKLDGRTRRALDMAIARKQVSQESYRAVLAGEITLQQAKELGRDRGPDGAIQGHSGPGTGTEISRSASAEDRTDTPPQPVSRISKDDTTQRCWCGCREFTSPNRRWKPGHDQRAKGIIRRAVKEGKSGELSDRLREYGAERGLLDA
jgi:hypothetical protein